MLVPPASMATTFSVDPKPDNDVKWDLCIRRRTNQGAVGDLF